MGPTRLDYARQPLYVLYPAKSIQEGFYSMRPFRFFSAFFLLMSLFASGVLAQPQSKKPEKVPVQIELNEKTLNGLSDSDRADVLKIKELYESRLWMYVGLPFELPDSFFDLDEGQIIRIDDYINDPETENLKDRKSVV